MRKKLRIIPLGNKNFKIEIVYEKEIKNLHLNKDNAIGIDIGINNLMAITSNNPGCFSWLVNGRPLKSMNQYFNKQLSIQKSLLSIINNKYWSNALTNLSLKRNNKIDDYLHKASRKVINHCIENDIGTIVIGHNNGWKQEINLGRKTNQSFVSIPFNKLIQMIIYKTEEIGISVVLHEESYTSKCDHLAEEVMTHHDTYFGRRIKRGLYRSSTGKVLNADINGSIGILRKANVVQHLLTQVRG